MLIFIVIIAIIVIYIYYKKHKQIPQDNNEQCINNAYNNSSKKLTAYDSVSDQSKTENTNVLNDNKRIDNIKIDDKELIQIQTQGVEINKNGEDNSELFTVVKEKINSQFIEPKEPEPLKIEVSFDELNIIYYCRRMFKKDLPYLPKHLIERMDIYNGLVDKGYFIQPTPDFFLNKKCKVDDLKEYLRGNNLSVSGNKNVLIQRILDNISLNQLENDFKISDYYILSEKGINIIDKYPMNLVNRPELESMLQAVYNHLNPKILLDNLEFVAEDIKFLDNYKEYDLPIKAFTLIYDKIGSSELNKLTNSYFDSYSEIFEELYDIAIPHNIFMQMRRYYHSFKELKKNKDTRLWPTYKIQSLNDERVCTFCKKMSNKEFLYSEAKIGINYPPFYDCKCDFCRCRVRNILDKSILSH